MNNLSVAFFHAIRYDMGVSFMPARSPENEMYHPYTNTHLPYIVYQDGVMRTGVTNPRGAGTYRRVENNPSGTWQMRVKRRAGGQKWKGVPREQLPKELKTWLLVLEISDGP